MGVAPDCRRRGVGRTLIGEAERWLTARGLARVHLLIRDAETVARDFYARLGYATKPRLVMEKWLDPARSPADDGRIEVVVTCLEMTAPPTRPTVPAPPAKLALLRAENPPVAFYRYLAEDRDAGTPGHAPYPVFHEPVISLRGMRGFCAAHGLRIAGEYGMDFGYHYRHLRLMNLSFIESNPVPVKASLALMGLCAESFRLPLCPQPRRQIPRKARRPPCG